MHVLLTGGAGWLGRAVMRYWPENEYVVYSRSEYLQALAREKYPDAEYVLGDIRDRERLERTLRGYSVDGIIHAAGIKRVQEAETNVWETIDVNVDGSRVVAQAASACGVEVAVAISTDKAVCPTTVYGQTKALMEKLWLEMAQAHQGSVPRYVVVRNGNFVGSTGSVIELWKRQLAEGKRIDLTDGSMTRFWQSAEETVRLIRCAVEGEGTGYVLTPAALPDIGGQYNGQVVARSMQMGELARLLTKDRPSLINTIGARPGDKYHERFIENGWTSGESLTLTGEEMLAMIAEAELV